MLILIDLHLHAWSASGDVESFIPVALFDIGFCAMDGLKCCGAADGDAVGAIADYWACLL
jgi:hypothetical protein